MRTTGILILALALPGPARASGTGGSAPYAEPVRGVAEQLDLDPAYVQGVRDGLDLLLRRRYDAATSHFEALHGTHPGTAIGAVGQAMIWQARALEDDGTRYRAEYRAASAAAGAASAAALADPSHQGWDHFLHGVTLGLDAVEAARGGEYVVVAARVVDATTALSKARDAAPDCPDLALADGVHHFWWSVVTRSSPLLADRDDRAQGLEEMRRAEADGAMLAPLATLALAYAHAEDNDVDDALDAARRFARQYPDNVLDNLLLGQLLAERGALEDAMRAYDQVLRVDPTNYRVRYLRGRALSKLGRPGPAVLELRAYLASPHLDDDQRAQGHYQLGQAHHRIGEYAEAERQFERAVRLTGHPQADDSLRRLRSAREAGRLSE